MDGEFSDLVMYQKVKDEMNGKTKKEDCEENMKDEEEKTVKVEEGEVKEGEEKMEGEKKVNTTEKKEIEKDEVMKEEKVEERMKDGEKKVEKMDEDDNEGVVTVLPTPFRPSKRARYTRVCSFISIGMKKYNQPTAFISPFILFVGFAEVYYS